MVLLVVLTVVSRSRVHDAHLDSLGLVGGGLSSGVHVDVEWVMEEVRELLCSWTDKNEDAPWILAAEDDH
jgi:hypothetical protein